MAAANGAEHEWNANRVRKTFLEYFGKNGHTFGGSYPAVLVWHYI